MDGTPVAFERHGNRLILTGLPAEAPDKTMGVTVFCLRFDKTPRHVHGSYYPQFHEGRDYSDGALKEDTGPCFCN